MTQRKSGGLTCALVSVVAAFGLMVPSAFAATPAKVKLRNTSSPAAAKTPSEGAVAGSAPVDFSVNLALADPQGARASPRPCPPRAPPPIGHYITAAQWEARFGPTAQTVQNVTQFLKSNGFTVGDVPADRLFVPATGHGGPDREGIRHLALLSPGGGQQGAAGHRESLGAANLAGQIAGCSGINQMNMRPTDTTGGPAQQPAATNGSNIPQPPGFRVATPCGQYANQSFDTAAPAYGQGYESPAPWAVCGYTPAQFRLPTG